MQKLVDEEFQGILHLRTSSLHKKVATARHDFVKLSGSENKLEALLQVYLFMFVLSVVADQQGCFGKQKIQRDPSYPFYFDGRY